MLVVPPTDRLALSQKVVRARRKRLPAHATRETLDVEDRSRRSEDEVRAADLLHAPGTLDAEDPLVIGSTVELELADEAGDGEGSRAGGAG